MKSFFASLALVASLVMAGPVSFDRTQNQTAQLELNIRSLGNTSLEAALINPTNSSLKLFVPGTILDEAPVEKVAVYKRNTRVPFDGVRLRLAPPELITDESFLTLHPNDTAILSFDFAQMHDVSQGGSYNVSAAGGIPYALANSTKIAGYIPFKSNVLQIRNVNGTRAAMVRRDLHAESKRVSIQAGCTKAQNTAVNNALIHCTNLANDAAKAAMWDTKKMQEFFKTTTMEARRNVSLTMSRVAKECGSRLVKDSISSLYCTDVYSSCKEGVLAYTVPSLKYMVNCPLYFDRLPSLTQTCHAQDQATTTLHEMTHLTQIRGTLDWGVYGYDAILTLPSEKNLYHADTFCLFANSVNLGSKC